MHAHAQMRQSAWQWKLADSLSRNADVMWYARLHMGV